MSGAGSGPSRPTPFEVVASIARVLGETVELRQVFARVAEAAQGAFAFDRMSVLRLEAEDALRVYAVASEAAGAPGDREGRLIPRSDFSPRFWRELTVDRIDTERELDPGYARDRETLEAGIRSIIRSLLRSGGQTLGVLAFSSRQAGAFTSEHEPVVRAVADLVAAALQHERLWSVEKERRRRSDALEALLPTLAQALDIRDIFKQVSDVTQDVIPHDVLALGLVSADRSRVHVHAMSEGQYREFPELPVLSEIVAIDREFFIIRDVAVGDRAKGTVHFLPLSRDGEVRWHAARIDPVRFRMLTTLGLRSSVGVPLRSEGKVVGGLTFYARRSDRYRPDDADLARRIADHVGLALAHQRLAEEERRSAEARAHAEHLESRVQSLTREVEALGGYRRIVGESRAWKDVLKQATQVAATDTTVLLLGDSGTGKEVVTRFIHRASARAEGPFVALNCAALPEPLLESELFGYEKGAFTGASQAKPGQIERAARGVLFLDEVGEMTLSAQAKFLRVLQEKEFQRLGGTRVLTADVRVVAATNRDLRAAVEDRTFREDLYYRLHVFAIRLPPLRERPDDILPLSEEFLAEIGRGFGRPPAGISREARERLLQYHWPGNVRELRNALERAAIVCEGGLITADHLNLTGPRSTSRRPRSGDDEEATGPVAPSAPLNTAAELRSREREMVERALKDARYNKSAAAKSLGLTRKQLYVRLRRHGLD